MDNHIFRSALSGFNRQDVMAYIERTQKQAEEAAAGLEARLAELEQAAAGAREELTACQEEREDLRRQLEDMTLRYNHAKNNWDAQSEAKDSFRRDVAQRDETVRELTGENQRLFRQVQTLEEEVQELRREKERIAQLELDAHRRSDEIVLDAAGQAELITSQAESQAAETVQTAETQARQTLAQAQADAQAVLRQAEEQIRQTVEQYGQLHQSFEAALGRITGELRGMDAAAAQLPERFNSLKAGLEELLEQAKEQ